MQRLLIVLGILLLVMGVAWPWLSKNYHSGGCRETLLSSGKTSGSTFR